jgi:predicted acyltransferase
MAELTTPDARPRASGRLRSLDVFRGLTVAGMLLVNDPGDAASVFAPLRHADWHGWTPTDLIFPFFLFIVGITTHLSLAAHAARGDDDRAIRRRILGRAGAIFALGVMLNWFPFYQAGAITGQVHPSFVERIVARLAQLRIPGVLQRIAVVYLAVALLARRASVRQLVAVTAVLLVGYSLALTLLPVPGEGAIGATLLGDPSRTLAAWSDRTLFDWTRWGLGNHLWEARVTWDPEGALSTLPAIATALLGVCAGRWIAGAGAGAAGERLSGLFAVSALATMSGLVWNWWLPINKNLWSSSYVLFTAGLAGLTLGTVIWLVDERGVTRGTRVFGVFGANPIVAFVGSELLARVIHSTLKVKVEGRRMGLEEWLSRHVFGAVLEPRAASLLYALCFVALWYAILSRMYRRGAVVRV